MTTPRKVTEGRILRIALSTRTHKLETIPEGDLKNYLGGVGYAARLLYDELPPGIDPFGPENKFIVATGPLTSYQVPGGGSFEVCFKSPANHAWGEARCGGDFGPELKRAGYDLLILEGQAETPLYLVIDDGKITYQEAGHLLGKTVSEKTRLIKEELKDDKYSILCIGPAGENRVRFASVMVGGRAAGRSGAGAVLGSKQLLAIAVKGTGRLIPEDQPAFSQALKSARQVIRESEVAKGFRDFGTMGDMAGNDAAGDWPTKNWQANNWGKGQALYDYYEKHNFIRNQMCYKGCPIACGRIAQVKDGPFKTPPHDGAEYESLSAFTAFVANEDMDAAIYSSYLCDEYGLDTISAGGVIAFALECYEHQLITSEQAQGLKLTWGNPEVLPLLIEKIAQRQGLGDLLAEGVARASQTLGKKSLPFAVHCKGLEGPAHDPRSGKALAVTYGTASRGMCHIHPLEGMAYDSGKFDWGMTPYGVPDPNTLDRFAEEGKGAIVKILQDGLILPDILGVCKFFMYAGLTLEHYAALLSALTGWSVTGKDLLVIGERTNNLQRLFNLREGLTAADDQLPERALSRPAFGAYHNEVRCIVKDYPGMLQEYYRARGWDETTGIPGKAKLTELGLEER